MPPGSRERLVVAGLLCLCALASADGPGSPTQDEVDHFNLVKELRKKGYTCPNGETFAPNNADFFFDCRLWRSAKAHARDMSVRNYFGHINPEGEDPCKRSLAQGLQACTENIGAGLVNGTHSFEGFQASDHHCPNMMNPELNRFGVGMAFTSPPGSAAFPDYWVQDMTTDNGHVDDSCNPPDKGTYVNPARSAAADDCKDLNVLHCAPFEGYAGSPSCNDEWPRTQCAKTCGFCGKGSASASDAGKPEEQGGCKDLNIHCLAYHGYNGSASCNEEWPKTQCPMACGFCPPAEVKSRRLGLRGPVHYM